MESGPNESPVIDCAGTTPLNRPFTRGGKKTGRSPRLRNEYARNSAVPRGQPFISTTLVPAFLFSLLCAGATALCAGLPTPQPTDALLRLVPPDVAVVVTIDNLRDQTNTFLKSRLADNLRRLPAVKAWLASEKYQHFERSRAQIETMLGTNLTDVRDELVGDAVVLALRLPPDAPADASQAKGILLVQARDPALLGRLIRVVNTIQQESGELAGVAQRQRNGTTYHVREFPAAANRPPEWYVAYSDGTFAFSNSEALIQSVIDRKARGQDDKDGAKAGPKVDPGLGGLTRLKAVQSKLPERALARLFIDPRQFERLLAGAPRPSKPSEARITATLERYLAAVDYAGAALTWNDESIVIHSVETLNPSLLDPWLRHWAGDTRRVDPTLARVPPSALAVASGHVDALAFFDAIAQIVPLEDQPKLTNIETMVTGLMLGHDLRSKVLPGVGPGAIAYLDAPSDMEEQGGALGRPPTPAAPEGWPFPPVMAISLGGDSGPEASANLAAAVENGIRTVLAVVAMDEKRAQGQSRIANRVVAGTTVTTLRPPVPFAYAVDRVRARLILSHSPGAIVRYLESSTDPKAGERFGRLRAAAFADAVTYACVDFDAVQNLAAKHRSRLVQTLAARQKRTVDEADRDLSHVLALARLFRAGFVSSRFDANATAVYRSVGMIRHEERGK
jgi:hypothetical protein